MKNKVILLVEDNPGDVALTLRAIAKMKTGHNVVVARDGAEALDYLFATGEHEGRDASILPQFVLLDLRLPKVDGLQVLGAIRKTEHLKRLPVVIFTAIGEKKNLIRSYNMGANSYVTKPVGFEDFCAAVRQLCWYWLIGSEGRSPDSLIYD